MNWGTVAAGLPTCAGKSGECLNVQIDNDDKEALTAIAAGNEFPLTIVGKEKTKRGFTRFQPPGDVWETFSESGWTTFDVMRKYVMQQAVFSDRPILLIVNTYTAHRSAEVRAVARDLEIEYNGLIEAYSRF
jgi:hypothetical protein